MDSKDLTISAHSIQSTRELDELVRKIDYDLVAYKMREVFNNHYNDLQYLILIEKTLDERKKRIGVLSKGVANLLTDIKDRIKHIQNKN